VVHDFHVLDALHVEQVLLALVVVPVWVVRAEHSAAVQSASVLAARVLVLVYHVLFCRDPGSLPAKPVVGRNAVLHEREVA
jgi:hypothetical protein